MSKALEECWTLNHVAILVTQHMGVTYPLSADGIDRSPGNWMHYSNLGFGVVGTIIERISGQRFDVYMKENVLEPMGLKASYNPGHFTADEIKDMAVLYQVLEENGPLVAQIDDYRGEVQDPNKVLITNPEQLRDYTLTEAKAGLGGQTEALAYRRK